MSETRPTLLDRWTALPVPWRLGVAALGLGVIAVFTVLSRPSADRPLLPQRQWSDAELQRLERALRQAEIEPIRRAGSTLYVPARKLAEATALAERLLADAEESEDPLERSLRETSLFTSPQQLQEIRDAALRGQLRRLLRSLPGVRDATVLWARDRNPQDLFAPPRVTATVGLQRDGQDALPPHVLQSIRITVANAVPDLRPEDVAIVELQNGRVYASTGPPVDTTIARAQSPPDDASDASRRGHQPSQADAPRSASDARTATAAGNADDRSADSVAPPQPGDVARTRVLGRQNQILLAAAAGLLFVLGTTLVLLRLRRRFQRRRTTDPAFGTDRAAPAAGDVPAAEWSDTATTVAADILEPTIDALRQRVIACVAADPRRAASVLAGWCQADSARHSPAAGSDAPGVSGT